MNKPATLAATHVFMLLLASWLLALATGTAQAALRVQMRIDANTLRPLIQERNLAARTYYMQVEQIIAHKVRKLRVAKERNAISQTGHPVELPTGICNAVVTIKPDGTVLRAELGACQHEALGVILKEAIQQASPLPPPGQADNMTVSIDAPVPTPGYEGN